MKVLIRAVLSGVVALTMIVAVVPAASAKPGRWARFDDRVTIPAGEACAHAVKARWRGAIRQTQRPNGVIIQKMRDWTYIKFRKQGSRKWVKVPAGGDARAVVKADGSLNVTFRGAQWGGAQRGVYGLLAARGRVALTLHNPGTPEEYVSDLDLRRAKKVRQICYRLGSRPVWGKTGAFLGL